MSWAAGRRMLILAIVCGVVLFSVGALAFFTLYKAPSCTDGIQNQDEAGVDCGGSCSYQCMGTVAPPVVRFARDIRLPNGRTDVIAYIESPKNYATKGAEFTIELYGVDHSIIAEKSGTVDLPSGASGVTPIYVPGFFSGTEEVAQAFVVFNEASFQWFRYEEEVRLLPVIENPVLSGTDAPKVRVGVENPNAKALRNLKLIVTVFDEAGNAIGASQTVVAELGPGNRTDAVFTWNAPFVGTPAVIEVRPLVSLP